MSLPLWDYARLLYFLTAIFLLILNEEGYRLYVNVTKWHMSELFLFIEHIIMGQAVTEVG